MTEISDFEDTVKRIDEIAEVTQLTFLPSTSDRASRASRMGPQSRKERQPSNCGRHLTVPSIYKLEGVVKEGDCPQRNSLVTEIWKGGCKEDKVALKVLRVGRGETDVQRMKKVSISRSSREELVDI
jgi:hypothetical protein